MGQPWGLSGPQFLGVYGAAIVAVIVVVSLFRQAMRQVPRTVAARELTPCEVGYLSGGPRRAAEVIIADLAAAGALRVDSHGTISEAGQGARSGQFADSFNRLWPHAMPAGLRTARVRDRLSSDAGIRGIAEQLRAQSLLISWSRVRAVRLLTLVLTTAAAIAGFARIAEGASSHRPVGGLVMLVIGVVIAGIVLARTAGSSNQPTTLGARYLRARPWSASCGALSQDRVQPDIAGFTRTGGLARAAGGAALFGVALAGFSAVDDPGLRSGLLAGLSASSGGPSSSCGGSSCGGGCGGGGCGG